MTVFSSVPFWKTPGVDGMGIFMNEFFASCLLIMIGCGVSGNVLLKGTKAPGRPWLIVIIGWAIGYSFSWFMVEPLGGAHINPLLTIAYLMLDDLKWAVLPLYFLGQLTGSFAGALIIYVYYFGHFRETVGAKRKLQVFVPTREKENMASLLFNETVGSFTFVFALLNFFNYYPTSSALPFFIGLTVMVTGIAFGSSVSYANNPARDLGPRFLYILLPIREKGIFRWHDILVQIFGSIIGGIYAALLFQRILLNVYHPLFWGITMIIVANLVWLLLYDRTIPKTDMIRKSS